MEGSPFPAAFVGEAKSGSKINIIDSYFIGTIKAENAGRFLDTLVGTTSTDCTITYKGAYTRGGDGYGDNTNYKKYWPGFTDSDWICSSGIDGGCPILKWNLWVGSHITTTSVETYLKNNGFKSQK